MIFTIKVLDAQQQVLFEKSAEDELYVVYDGEYKEGDAISLSCDENRADIVLMLDDCMGEVTCHLRGIFTLPIPFGEKKASYNPKAFSGTRHYMHVRAARKEELSLLRNLAINPYDCHGNKTLFPHAWANVETRGESVFAARNAIDGLIANTFHGEWPYTSWGINRDPNAELHIDFGRVVIVRAVVVYLRADFPHDAWWKEATVTFDDGPGSILLEFEKRGNAHIYTFPDVVVSSIKLHSLVKADDPSPFPALTQLEVYGIDGYRSPDE